MKKMKPPSQTNPHDRNETGTNKKHNGKEAKKHGKNTTHKHDMMLNQV